MSQLDLPPARTILSLFDYSGNWARPYSEAGYSVIRVDLKHGEDVRLYEVKGLDVHGVLAAPPCTHFAGSGAQYWPAKDEDGRTLQGLELIGATCRIILATQPEWWVIENPVGRLNRWLGQPRMYFQPHEYAGWAPDPEKDRYAKRTALWGSFRPPEPHPLDPIRVCKQGSWVQRLGGSSERTKELRSMTPMGFAYAFAAANP